LRLPTHSPVHSHNGGRSQKAIFDPNECNHASFRAHRPDFLDFLCAPFCNFCTLLENDLWYTIFAYGATRICAAYVSGFSPYRRFGRYGIKSMRVPLMRTRFGVLQTWHFILSTQGLARSSLVILLVTSTFYARFCSILSKGSSFCSASRKRNRVVQNPSRYECSYFCSTTRADRMLVCPSCLWSMMGGGV